MASDTPDEPAHVRDARTLSATELRAQYEPTYSSWRNMKQRRKKGAIIHPAFESFSSFLEIVGPRPSPEHTVDRIDNQNPEYGPGLVQWADKRGQANNRSTTIMLTHEGRTAPLMEWAAQTGENPDTMRDRHGKGWSDYEVIFGRQRTSQLRGDPWNWRPWEHDQDARAWDRLYAAEGRHRETPAHFLFRKAVERRNAINDQIELPPEGYERELTPEVIRLLADLRRAEEDVDRALAFKKQVEATTLHMRWPKSFGARKAPAGTGWDF